MNVFLTSNRTVMTEHNDENRRTTMTSELTSHSSEPSLVNHDLSRNVSAEALGSSNEFELSVSSHTTLNDMNQINDSTIQQQQPLPSIDSNNNLTSSIPPASTEPIESSSGPSFAQLAYQKLETSINEMQDQIVPIQEMISGYGEGLARLAQSTHNQLQMANNQLEAPPPPPQGRFLEPIALRRNIHSTPMLRRSPDSTLPAINDEVECEPDSDEDCPPPAGLEILDLTRSRSTPLSTSENSAFGTILRTNSHRVNNSQGGSAFSLPPYKMKKSNTRSNERVAHAFKFNPIVHEDEVLKTVEGDEPLSEMTSIEVTDVPHLKEETQPKKSSKKMGMIDRTAKLLSDFRNLSITSGNSNRRGSGSGRKNRPRDGRENPARPASISSDEQSRASTIGSVASSNVAERKDPIRPVIVAVSTARSNSIEHTDAPVNAVENTTSDSSANERVVIQVNDHSVDSIDIGSRQSYIASSPEPSEILDQSDIQDSPNSTRFPPSISNSSGRLSYGTSTSSNSNTRSHGSHLSSISETDREVANVNLLQRDRGRLQIVGEQIELSLSSDRSIRSRDLNGSLNGSISVDSSARRDGASVRADRFFNRKDLNRLRHLPPFTRRSGWAQSPTTGSSNASVNTSSTNGSDEPPKIVSYLDRKQISDLSSLYHRQCPYETSSPRADHDHEVRDSSPSDQMEIVFEGAHAAQIDICNNRPRPSSVPNTFPRKNRSLPPRSPINNILPSTTPPPRIGSPAYNAMSPPRQIVGHPLDPVSTNLSKPRVVAPKSYRSNLTKPFSSTLTVADTDVNPSDPIQEPLEPIRLSPNCDYYNLKPAARGISPVYGHQGGRTYEESSIEILKTDSKDDAAIPLVTPDKENPSS